MCGLLKIFQAKDKQRPVFMSNALCFILVKSCSRGDTLSSLEFVNTKVDNFFVTSVNV